MNFLYLIGGVVFLIAGIFTVIHVFKYPIDPSEDTNMYNYQGAISSFLAIILGLFLILKGFGVAL
ncbi:MAG: hypothetical protein DRI74_07195 [Bacteroidetes bacterium]|nr:MAG: hypothetical protein DRI74_07195 [Bacteroidota bacterium]